MKKAIVAIAVVFVSLTCCIGVFGDTELSTGGPVVPSADWPEGVKELVNREARVHSYWGKGVFLTRSVVLGGAEKEVQACPVTVHEFFCFADDTNAFNDFLAQYAMLKDTPLTLVLHPGCGGASSPWEKEKQIPFDWQLTILRRGWESRYPHAPPGPVYGIATEAVMTDLWLGGQVQLDKVEVPLNVEVKSGGEIERFIAAHQARQQAQNLPD